MYNGSNRSGQTVSYPENSDIQKQSCNFPKIKPTTLYQSEICPKDPDRMANSVDPDQTVPSVIIVKV